jgi:hypothetical protein
MRQEEAYPWRESLEARLRERMRELIEQVLEEEVEEAQGAPRYRRSTPEVEPAALGRAWPGVAHQRCADCSGCGGSEASATCRKNPKQGNAKERKPKWLLKRKDFHDFSRKMRYKLFYKIRDISSMFDGAQFCAHHQILPTSTACSALSVKPM